MYEAHLRVANGIGRFSAAFAAMGMCASASAYLAPGGTITFHGELVAQPFIVGAFSTAQSGGFGANSVTGFDATGAQVATVRFDTSPNSAPSAEVWLRAADGRTKPAAVETRFTDGHGRVRSISARRAAPCRCGEKAASRSRSS
ncbi:hypothetical protein BUMB_02823c [Candidatus Paraburkholderia calva]|nr:hypothetical protein BUMB_02823c [Candidatus Paraburkholderia calva]